MSKRENTTKDNLSYRANPIQTAGFPSTLDEKSRSVEIVATTEEPVEVFDFERFEVVPEVLLMSGAELPKNRQVPLLDAHRRFDAASVIGSVRDLKPENSQLMGRAYFSSVQDVESIWTKLREGHVTDFSVGYRSIKSQWVPEGESYNYEGRSFEGPVKVTKRWRLKEVSVVPIGADELAKARTEARSESESVKREQQGDKNKMEKSEIQKIQEAERQRVIEITAMCRSLGFEELTNNLINEGTSIETARKIVLDKVTEKREAETKGIGYYPSFSIVKDQVEKRSEATVDGLVLRAGVNLEKPSPGSNEYRVLSLVEIARECLAAAGENVRGLSKNSIVQKALQQRAAITGDFPYILSNTLGKVLRQSYDLTPSTYELWCNITEAQDFKEMSRNQLSEGPDLDEVPEHGVYKYGTFGESKEVFSVVKYGKLFAITREAIINDDLGAFTRIPRAFAMSAKRKVNESVYAILTANSAMADGVALFDASTHKNYVGAGSGGAPDEDTLNAGRSAMRLQTGLQGAVLNIAPAFLIVPAALETTADKLLNSAGDLTDYKSSGVVNPFYKKLEPVVEALLDADSTTAWYLAANPAQIDTVEVAFLGGNRGPYLETKDGWTVDGVEYKVRIEFGVKAIDHRGLYFNAGA